ncbi:MAG TPA: methionine--tRNA ligase subunit beta, partial [Methylomirabilota bacterium]|nr:methionine--tRNA ligase subunit beta [Methylomirabilota bacterium]
VGRLNADLANDLGNLVARATTLIASFRPGAEAPGPAQQQDEELVALFGEVRDAVDHAVGEFALSRALADVWRFIAAANRYIDKAEPWRLARDERQRDRLHRVLLTLADALRGLGIVLDPFVPEAAAKIRRAVEDPRPPRLEHAVLGALTSLPAVQKLSGLFPRVETAPAPGEARAPGARSRPEGAAAPAAAGRLTRDEFAKVELRVAQVLAAEPVPKSRKLLRLRVSLGTEERTMVAGIAEHYAPADLVGKKVVVVANLEPARLMGIESQGMVLAGSADAVLAVLTPDRDLPPGATVS